MNRLATYLIVVSIAAAGCSNKKNFANEQEAKTLIAPPAPKSAFSADKYGECKEIEKDRSEVKENRGHKTASVKAVAVSKNYGLVNDEQSDRTIGTNLQSEGIDESDKVKVGEFHIIVTRGQEFSILDRKTLKLLGTIARQRNDVVGVHFVQGRLVLVTNINARTGGDAVNRHVQIDSYDLVEGQMPRSVAREDLDGRLLDSRVVGGKLVLVTSVALATAADDGITIKPAPVPEPLHIPSSERPERQVPKDDAVAEVPCTEIYKLAPLNLGRPDPQATSSEATLNLSQTLETLTRTSVYDVSGKKFIAKHSAVMGDVDFAYVSESAVYLVRGPGWGASGSKSSIFKQSLVEGAQLGPIAIGDLKGSIASRWHLHELSDKSNLAVIVSGTVGKHGESGQSAVVLGEEAAQLKSIGELDDLAPGESLQSVRFDGDMGYIVTYREFDPLFAIDFAKPTEPMLMGQLEVSGYSTYLHMMNGKRLLGLGRSESNALQLRLFDVANPFHPTSLFNEEASQAEYSEAEREPHAFFADLAENVIGFPLAAQAWKNVQSHDGSAMFFKVTDSFKALPKIENGDACGGNSQITRILKVDERILTFSDESVRATDARTLYSGKNQTLNETLLSDDGCVKPEPVYECQIAPMPVYEVE